MKRYSIPACPRVAVSVDKTSAYGRGVLRGVADYVEIHGPWSLCLDHHSSGHHAGDWLRHWRGDGVLAYVDSPELARQLRRSRIPVVELFGTRQDLGLPQVANDDTAIGNLAAEHLLERRFRHFGFLGYRGASWSERRQRGFEKRLQQEGFPVVAFLCDQQPGSLAQWERTQVQIRQWLESLVRPTGIMACSDRHALRLLDACRQSGIAVPEEVAVIGVDNDEETCRLADPPLSSVMDQGVRIGFEASRWLHELMRAGSSRSPVSKPCLIPPMGVATRRSTEITAITDPVVARAARVIRERACEGVTVQDLLREIGLSRTLFYERFETALGRSPHQEILRIKLERVRQLLCQTRQSVEEIAAAAGFRHPEYLQVAFKRAVGMTPGRFRRANSPPS